MVFGYNNQLRKNEFTIERSNSCLKIDISEKSILSNYGKSVLELLLQDKTTGCNIIWATKDYEAFGNGYQESEEITLNAIIGFNARIIQPRITKESSTQVDRTRDRAEVFTPCWICNDQNNLVDNAWFGRENVFNFSQGTSWITNTEKIEFPSDESHTWEDYIDARRLEMACGEAPYLVSRYDVVSGNTIPVIDRIGLLDRKLRIVNENCDDEEKWLKWTARAYQSIYGFEFQGDNLLIARENLLFTFIDNLEYKFKRKPEKKELSKIAEIIAWNVWQMDGFTYTIPFGKTEQTNAYLTDDTSWMTEFWGDVQEAKTTPECIIKDWRTNTTESYKSMIEEGK